MSRADVSIRETGGLLAPPTDRYTVDAGTPITVKAGEPTKLGGTAATNVILLVDGDLTIATDQPFTGVAVIDSTETASAAGYVDCYTPLVNLLYEIKAKTASLANTQALVDAFIGEAQVMDLTSSVFTMDTAGGNASANAFKITGGDPNRSTVWFRVRSDGSMFGRAEV